ncbi:MAG: hypothetical protein IJX74_03450 [Clostridia bacterium]|nr:hypothetical protein [Clostridia bacterium]
MRGLAVRLCGAALAVALLLNCWCVTKISAENAEGCDVKLSFGLWSQTDGVFTLPLRVTVGERGLCALILEIFLPEGCDIIDVSAVGLGDAAASAFLTVKHRAAVTLTLPESPPPGTNIPLLVRFTAKGGAKGKASVKGAGDSENFCAAAAWENGKAVPLTVGAAERNIDIDGVEEVIYLGQKTWTDENGRICTRFLFLLIYIEPRQRDEPPPATVYVVKGEGTLDLRVTEIEGERYAFLAYTFEGLKEGKEYEFVVES